MIEVNRRGGILRNAAEKHRYTREITYLQVHGCFFIFRLETGSDELQCIHSDKLMYLSKLEAPADLRNGRGFEVVGEGLIGFAP